MMGAGVWYCATRDCWTEVPEGAMYCPACTEKIGGNPVTEIRLGDITYSRSTHWVRADGRRGLTQGHMGRRAISVEHMSEALREQIREFVLRIELATDRRSDGQEEVV